MSEIRQITVKKSGEVKFGRTVKIDENLIKRVKNFLQILIDDATAQFGLIKNKNISNRDSALKNKIWNHFLRKVAVTESRGGSFLRDLFTFDLNKTVFQSFRKLYINVFEASKDWDKAVESMARQLIHYAATSKIKGNLKMYRRHCAQAALSDIAFEREKSAVMGKRAKAILKELRKIVASQPREAKKRIKTAAAVTCGGGAIRRSNAAIAAEKTALETAEKSGGILVRCAMKFVNALENIGGRLVKKPPI